MSAELRDGSGSKTIPRSPGMGVLWSPQGQPSPWPRPLQTRPSRAPGSDPEALPTCLLWHPAGSATVNTQYRYSAWKNHRKNEFLTYSTAFDYL